MAVIALPRIAQKFRSRCRPCRCFRIRSGVSDQCRPVPIDGSDR